MINCCHRRSKAQSPPSLFTLGQLLLHPPVLTQAVLHNDDRSSSNNTTVTPPATLCQYWSISTISAAYPKLIYPPVLPPQMIDLLIQHSWSKSSKPCPVRPTVTTVAGIIIMSSRSTGKKPGYHLLLNRSLMFSTLNTRCRTTLDPSVQLCFHILPKLMFCISS